MKNECFDCGLPMQRRTRYTVDDPYVGQITVEGEYWHCSKCGVDEVPYATLKAVEDERKRIADEMLWKSLKGTEEFDKDFMLTHELAEFLGITRQAVAQSKVIADSIFNITIKGCRYWLRKSAELYRDKGDGWFPLSMLDTAPSGNRTRGWIKAPKGRRKADTAASPVLSSAD